MGDQLADLTSHRIEGFATHGGHFSVPLYSQIQGNVWMGGTPATAGNLAPEFDTIVCLYPWEKYRTLANTVKVEAWLYDDASGQPDSDVVNMLAEFVNAALARGSVLVHCQAGLNRSSLVTARALMLNGMKADDAIALIREKRSPECLCNRTFEAWLRAI
jgi:hypothetical protein